MNSLSEIKTRYPESVKAKPKGWKFIYGKTIIREDDMVWQWGEGPFILLKHDFIVGNKAESYVPIIREIKTKPKPKPKPNVDLLLKENAALKKELADLKEKIRAFAEGVK